MATNDWIVAAGSEFSGGGPGVTVRPTTQLTLISRLLGAGRSRARSAAHHIPIQAPDKLEEEDYSGHAPWPGRLCRRLRGDQG